MHQWAKAKYRLPTPTLIVFEMHRSPLLCLVCWCFELEWVIFFHAINSIPITVCVSAAFPPRVQRVICILYGGKIAAKRLFFFFQIIIVIKKREKNRESAGISETALFLLSQQQLVHKKRSSYISWGIVCIKCLWCTLRNFHCTKEVNPL